MWQRWVPALAVSVAWAGLADEAEAQNGGSHSQPVPAVAALRAAEAITVDGRLAEAAWQRAEPATDFRQTQPDEGVAATQRTEVRFLFDDGALYIGARMFDDRGAAGVVGRLVRRDGQMTSDELVITFDTFHDHLGQTVFRINPSGVRGDALGQGGSSPDDSWDPIYQAATAVDSLGWTAELRIPLSQLRFPRDSGQTWGLQLRRTVHRLNEWSTWAWWQNNESGGPTRYGHLTGLTVTAQPGRAELLPYVVGRSTNRSRVDAADPFDRAHALDYRVGGDFKYLVTSNLTLNATVNPDFGQVEVDPAVVNLSAFETFFEERRPFFVEGAGLFRFGGLNCFFCSNVSGLSMFYPRRIGRRPQAAGNAFTEGPYADMPDNTTILGAAKLTGRTRGGWSIGVLDAVTRRERATVQRADGSRTEATVEPMTNYFVGRVGRDLRGGNTVLRGIVTSVVRDLDAPGLRAQLTSHAEGLGFETDHWWGNRTYRLMGTFAMSQVSGDPLAIDRIQRSSARYFQRPDREHGGNGLSSDRYDPSLTSLRGWAGYARLAKQSGDWLWETQTNIRSPGFEVNDIAFLTRADYVWMSGNLRREFTRPTAVSRFMGFTVGGQQQYNFDGDRTDRQAQASAFIQLRNYWEMGTFYIHRWEVEDDRLTRGGPVVRRAASDYFDFFIGTDPRRNLGLSLGASRGCNTEQACSWSTSLNAELRPAANVTIRVGPSYSHDESRAQFVTAVDDPTATTFFGRRYVFADLSQNQLSMNTRLNVTFTPTLSLELFAQPFIASGRFSEYKEFAAPRSLAKKVYGRDRGTITSAQTPDGRVYTVDPDGAGPAASFSFRDRNFTSASLRGNAVLRWEYRPGSTLFLVWTQARSQDAAFGDLSFGRDFKALFQGMAENIFLVKMNYWIGF